MKTFYLKTTMKFLKLLPALIFFMLAYSYQASSQTVNNPPICYGEPIELECSFISGGCGAIAATYHWENYSGSWSVDYTWPYDGRIYIYPAGHVWQPGDFPPDYPTHLLPQALGGTGPAGPASTGLGYANDFFYLSVQYPISNFSGGRVTVVLVPGPQVTLVPVPVSCFGYSDGSVTANVTGGVAPYYYSWSTGATTQTISGLVVGNYSVTVTDSRITGPGSAIGCTNWPGSTTTVTGPTQALAINNGVTSNPVCFGACDGSITGVYATGGTAPYSYSWTGPNGFTANTADINDLCPGTYELLVTDDHGCTETTSYTLTDPAQFLVTGTATDTKCLNSCDGEVNTSLTNGTAPFSYVWSNGATTENITGLCFGDYSVTVTDGKGCVATGNWSVGSPSALTVTGDVVDALCSYSSDGSIDITPDGATPPYSFEWSTGATTEDVGGLAAGTYSVTIKDANQCELIEDFTVGAPDELVATGTTVNVNCYNGADGSIDLSVAGGTAPYTFSWSNLETSEDISGLTAGWYYVTVTDDHGCMDMAAFEITQPTEIVIDGTPVDGTCNTSCDGKVTVNVNGGVAPYTYLWSNSATDANIENLCAGDYTLTVTDDHGCQMSETFTVSAPPALGVVGVVTDALCNNSSDGSIDITVSGGTSPYQYLWSTGATTEDIDGLPEGTYIVTITDANLCTLIDSWDVYEPGEVSWVGEVINVTCNGAADGIINTLSTTGGTSPYTYYWEGPSGFTSTDANLANLAPGTYNLTVTDAHSCDARSSRTVTEPDVLEIDPVATIVQPLCFGSNEGSISDVVITGGTDPYTYLWSTGETTESISGLIAGIYGLTVTDFQGCEAYQSFEVGQPTQVTVQGTPVETKCDGSCDGSISVVADGGTAPYYYAWSNAATTADISGLCAGSYTVTVKDANSCETTGTWTVGSPAPLDATAVVVDALCNNSSDGSIDMTVTGGTTPYSYLWSNGETTQDINGLAADTYFVTITDANDCELVKNWTVNEPGEVSWVGEVTNVTCNGYNNGMITTLSTDGGTSPYTYYWEGPGGFTSTDANLINLAPGTYNLTVTDAHSCDARASRTVTEPDALEIDPVATIVQPLCFGSNEGSISDVVVTGGTDPYTYLWSTSETTESISGLIAGIYGLTVTDFNGCEAYMIFEVGQPTPVTVQGTPVDTKCDGSCDGSISAVADGGTAPYYYEWSNGETTAEVSGLCAGSYTVTVKDANSCETAGTWTVGSPAPLGATADVVDALCNNSSDGSIDMTVTGGTTPYSYLWSNGETTQDINGLAADTYFVTITDANDCELVESWTVNEPGEVSWVGEVTNVTCNGYNNGMITTLSTDGGTAPYTYYWEGPSGFTSTDANLTNLAPGTYNLTVTDAHSCDARASRTVTEPDVLEIDPVATIVQPLCFGSNEGSISDVVVTGGTNPYTFLWSTGETTESISNLLAGIYSLTVTDANSCEAYQSFEVGQPTQVTVDGTPVNTLCYLSCDGSISVVAGGGTAPYYYAWSNGATTDAISDLCAGTYTVTVSDAHSCEVVGSFTVDSPTAITVTADITDALCNNSSDGAIDITPDGGTPSYTFVWSTGETTEDISGLFADTYTVTITDSHNCELIESFVVNEPGEVSWVGEVTNVTCNGYNNGMITTLSTDGGTAPYTYYWEGPGGFTSTDANLTNLAPGTYNLTVTDSHSCDARASRTVTEPEVLVIDPVATIVQPLCFGSNEGSISDVVVTGGTDPYTFLWSTGETTESISGLIAGTYGLTVTDFNGCEAYQSFEVGQPTPVAVQGYPVDTKCDGSCDGEITTLASGGTAPYYYAWSNGATTADVTGLCAGSYTVTVKDANSCETTGTWTIGSPAPLGATAVVVDALCNNSLDGSIDMTVTGGTTPYSYIWSNGETTQDISGLGADTYFVTITDANDCELVESWTVNEPGEVSWTGEVTNVSCFEVCDGTITTTSTLGGTPPYTYYWEGPNGFTSTNENLSGLCVGTYHLTVTDSHSCDARSSRTITQPDLLVISSAAVITIPTCYTGCDGAISGVVVTGGTEPYSYSWSNGATTADISGLCAGDYTLTVTDANNCTAEMTFTVDDAPWWDFSIEGPAEVCCSTSTTNTIATYSASDLTGTWSLPLTWQWTVEGGIILSGQNTDEITVLWSCCGTGKVYLTINQGPIPCALTKVLNVNITATPAPVIAGPVSVIANDTATYCVVNGDPGHLYTWNVVGGVLLSGQGTPCITVVWGDYPPCGCGEVTVCESTQLTPGVPGCTGCATQAITILPNTAGINLSGTVTYKNGFGTALNGVTINLRNVATNTIVATTVTGPNMNPPLYTGDPGYYAFMNVPAGNYKLEASFNGAWGGNNATDALLIQIEAGTPGYLLANYGLLNVGVADVNGSAVPPSTGVTALDALYVKLRTVGSISSYPAGDWRFDNPTVTIPVAGNVNFNGLCYGDVNGSYIPTGLKEASYLSVIEDVTQTVPVEETFTYSIRSNSSAKLGAMTLFMGYDAEQFEVIDIASQNDEMKYVIENGTVAIAWADTKPMTVGNNDELFTLTVKAKAPVSDASPIFVVKTGSEFADATGNRYDNFEVKMSKVITPSGSNEFTLFNYPNPFAASTKIVYSIPEAGSVKLVVTDMYGKTISTLVDAAQNAGSYTVNLNAADLGLAAGVYLYRIEVAGATENFVKVNKLIFAK